MNVSLPGVRGTTPRHGRLSFLRTSSPVLDRVVDEFEPDRPGDPGDQAKAEADDQVEEQIGLERQARDVGAVDDRDRSHADAAGDPDLLVALEQRVIERTVGVHVALQDGVLDASSAQVQHRALEPRDPRLERLLSR